MGRSKRRLGTTAAVSAAALASLLGAPAASADGHEVCVDCVIGPGPGLGDGGLANAFLKLSDKQFPGATADAFLKVGGQNAFGKLAGKEFPGNTGDVFFK